MTSEVLEELDLSQCSLSKNLLAEDIGHFLDSNTLSILRVGGRAIGVNMRLLVRHCPTYQTIPYAP